MIAVFASESVVALETRLEHQQDRLAGLHARVTVLDTGIAELGPLIEEIEQRLRQQEGEVARLMVASGQPITFGNDYSQRAVYMTSGGETVQLSGPRPADTAREQADHAKRVLDALELEAAPIRSTLARMERERQEITRAIAAVGGEINSLEIQIARVRAEESARIELIGRVDWRSRLADIMRRLSAA